jgi:hypothetical protein
MACATRSLQGPATRTGVIGKPERILKTGGKRFSTEAGRIYGRMCGMQKEELFGSNSLGNLFPVSD